MAISMLQRSGLQGLGLQGLGQPAVSSQNAGNVTLALIAAK
jgi:hypothetical protein